MKKFFVLLLFFCWAECLFSQSEQTYLIKEKELFQLKMNLKQLENINKQQQQALKQQETQLMILSEQLTKSMNELEQANKSLTNANKSLRKLKTENQCKIIGSIILSATAGFFIGKLVPY